MTTDTSWSAVKEKKGVNKGLLWIVISTMLIVALISATAWQLSGKSQAIWSDTNWQKLVAGWLLMCSALWALGHRWRVLLPTVNRPPGTELGAAICGALLLNYAIPGPFGELAAAHHIHRRHKIPFATSLATSSVARLVGLFTAAVGALAISATTGVALAADHRWALWLCLIGIAGGAALLATIFLAPNRWIKLNPSPKTSRTEKIKIFMADLAKAIVECSKSGALPMAFLWSIFGHFLAGAGLALSIDALYGGAQWSGLAVTYLVGTCLGAIAFLFPGSQFAWDALIAGLLKSTAGLSGLQSIGGALTLRIEQLWMMGLGALSLQWLARKPKRRDQYLE